MNQPIDNVSRSTDEVPTMDAARKKSLVASGVGNLLEWYDWTIYAVASVYIASALFDKADPTSALLSTLAVFAVGFISRPFGGFIFGPLADKIGRRNVLMITMLLMAGASIVIALIPSFEQIGYWASLILVLARLVQGFAHGGETTTSYAYVSEIAPPKKRGLWSSTVFFAVGLGSLTATLFLALLTSVIPKEEMYEWGWRIPFLLGGVLAFFALYLRRNMMESEHVEKMQQDDSPAWPLSRFLKTGIKLFFYEAGSTLTYYIWVTVCAIYAINHLKMDPHDAFVMSCFAQVVYLICLPIQGWLSDIIGRKTSTLISFGGSMIFLFPLWGLLSSEPWTLFVAQAVGLVFVGFLTASKPAAMSEQIPTRYRTKLFGIFMSLSIAVFGGTASYVNTWLYANQLESFFNVYAVIVCIVAIGVVLTWKDNKGIDLDKV
ncbi:MFS transporter [Acinetobacter bereziniae]|uniref:MFS transporter n=1 Tax=Acinetobacter bereziniae TaxID=106648 RepID=UPI001C06BFD8|nr:MFS transporter [Acinetobacter bereziniae]